MDINRKSGRAGDKRVIDDKVRLYFIQKVMEKYPEDFWLIEDELDPLIAQYGLRELLAVVGLRIQRIKGNHKQTIRQCGVLDGDPRVSIFEHLD